MVPSVASAKEGLGLADRCGSELRMAGHRKRENRLLFRAKDGLSSVALAEEDVIKQEERVLHLRN